MANFVKTGNWESRKKGYKGELDLNFLIESLSISPSLASAHILVGNSSNLATSMALTGDASITNLGVLTVNKINGAIVPTIGSANTILGVNNAGTALEYKTVSNGLTSSSNAFKLGGSLNMNTIIGGATKTYALDLGGNTLGGPNELAHLEVRAGYIDMKTSTLSITLDSGTGLNLNAQTQATLDAGPNSSQLLMNTTLARFTDRRTTKKGIEYNADYSADFTSRSLVDKGYTDSHFAGNTFTVNVVSPTAPNRTIKVTISGVDYYIAAKLTND